MATRRRYSSETNEIRKRTSRYGQSYVDGNLAVQPEVIPERRPKRKPRPKRETGVQQEPVKMLVISQVSLIFIVVLALIVAAFALAMIKQQQQIRKVRNEIKVVRAANAETERVLQDEVRSINDDVDLSKVYRIATKKLGMKAPTSNKKINYKYQKSDVIKQYADIPDK
ncbi:MAG: hypothetical protein K6D02_08180 [Lachnospiraceae bacterium]|nr:hypothetical protein [Lachnospiraceae bacterium]